MKEIYKRFIKDSETKAFDPEHRKRINFNISKYNAAVVKGKQQFADMEKAKKHAAHLKSKVLANLDKYLINFESNFERNGGKVIWAQDKDEAVKHIVALLKKHEVKHVVKSKSMITEEIVLNDRLSENGIEPLETDLGEYIVQVAGEHPYHIVTPVMHKSKEDIAELFHEKFNTPAESTPEEMTLFVREKLRNKFVAADAGITGANFLIADTGSVALTENEGNGMMSFSFPKVHIAIAGIEKIIPSRADLHTFWPLLASHGTGQNVTVYNSIVSGPKKAGETDGPEHMYVILLDNKRSELLALEKQRIALSCIKCGACLNVCPVYKNIGGHAYGTTYSGPIGSVISPHLLGMKDYKHLSFASSLCGACTEVCPVKIPLHDLLLQNRNDSVKSGYTRFSDRATMTGWKKVMQNRWMIDMTGYRTKNLGMRLFFKKVWGRRRSLPELKGRSFSEIWRDKHQ